MKVWGLHHDVHRTGRAQVTGTVAATTKTGFSQRHMGCRYFIKAMESSGFLGNYIWFCINICMPFCSCGSVPLSGLRNDTSVCAICIGAQKLSAFLSFSIAHSTWRGWFSILACFASSFLCLSRLSFLFLILTLCFRFSSSFMMILSWSRILHKGNAPQDASHLLRIK